MQEDACSDISNKNGNEDFIGCNAEMFLGLSAGILDVTGAAQA